MYLACVFLDHGLALRRGKPEGPDICIDSTPRMWVEAIAVDGGQGDDRVLNNEERRITDYVSDPNVWHGRPPSEESLIKRSTHALEKKRKQYEKYRAKGEEDGVKETDVYIVAISFARIEDAVRLFNYDEIPIVIKAFFGIGPDMLSVSRDGRSKVFNPPRSYVTKRSGEEVETTAFATRGAYDIISGVFATYADLANSPDSGEKIMFINNPNARNPVPAGTFRFGTEFIASDVNIVRKHWSRLNGSNPTA